MSNYNAYTTPVRLMRSFFFLVTMVLVALSVCSVTSFANSKIISMNIYHQHTGSSGGGGCYTIRRSGTTTQEIPCGGTMVYWPNLGSTSCDRCGASYYGDQSHRECWHSEKITSSYTYYDLGCNMDTSTIVGSFSVEPATKEWTKSLQLQASYQMAEGVVLPDKPYIWNGQEATDQNTYMVTQNGEYTLGFNNDANTVSDGITITVGNIDITAPVIRSHSAEPQKDWTKTGVWVTLGKIEDLQPDGSKGCGLHEKPLSYDGGRTWEAQIKHLYMENGTHHIMVRDKLENTSSYTVVINNIDVTAPVIRSHATNPETDWTKEGVWITIGEAEDVQPDGSKGCGLHANAFSFDDGKTWSCAKEYFVEESGVYSILVRDKLENTASYSVEIRNVDKEPPVIKAIEYDDTPNLANTTVTVTALDLQPDGSEGSGLHEQPYSFDGGNTWSEEGSLFVEANQTFTVAVRDKMENISYQEVAIINIDDFAPRISYEMVHPYWTNKDVNLYLHAEDINADGSDGIGLEENWYSLDGGNSWTNEKVQVYEENQEVTVYARDRNNNISNVHISIRQIDKDLPWVTINMEVIGEGADKKVKLTAFGGDDYSGIHEEGYSWDKGCSYSRQQVKMVTENGVYQATVRDKAGNWNYEQIEVDVFEIPVIEEKPAKKVLSEKKEKAVTEEITEETVTPETETVVVEQERRIEEPVPQVVQKIEKEDRNLDDILTLLCAAGALLGLLLFLLFLWLRTAAVYEEDAHDKMRYIGRVWIRRKKDYFEVHFGEALLEKCITTHFNLRPCRLFAGLHKKEQLCCLFPDDICITLEIERNMDFLLI